MENKTTALPVAENKAEQGLRQDPERHDVV